jgi:hypothetical protein
MDWLIIGSSRRRDPISWSPEARQLFTQIADEVSGNPGIKVADGSKGLKRPCIFSGRRLAVAGHDDGIAVRLDGEHMRQALQISGCRLLSRRDGLPVKGMIAVPWSAHDHWKELTHLAVAS